MQRDRAHARFDVDRSTSSRRKHQKCRETARTIGADYLLNLNPHVLCPQGGKAGESRKGRRDSPLEKPAAGGTNTALEVKDSRIRPRFARLTTERLVLAIAGWSATTRPATTTAVFRSTAACRDLLRPRLSRFGRLICQTMRVSSPGGNADHQPRQYDKADSLRVKFHPVSRIDLIDYTAGSSEKVNEAGADR